MIFIYIFCVNFYNYLKYIGMRFINCNCMPISFLTLETLIYLYTFLFKRLSTKFPDKMRAIFISIKTPDCSDGNIGKILQTLQQRSSPKRSVLNRRIKISQIEKTSFQFIINALDEYSYFHIKESADHFMNTNCWLYKTAQNKSFTFFA